MGKIGYRTLIFCDICYMTLVFLCLCWNTMLNRVYLLKHTLTIKISFPAERGERRLAKKSILPFGWQHEWWIGCGGGEWGVLAWELGFLVYKAIRLVEPNRKGSGAPETILKIFSLCFVRKGYFNSRSVFQQKTMIYQCVLVKTQKTGVLEQIPQNINVM